jgi:hypothetical protein
MFHIKPFTVKHSERERKLKHSLEIDGGGTLFAVRVRIGYKKRVGDTDGVGFGGVTEVR